MSFQRAAGAPRPPGAGRDGDSSYIEDTRSVSNEVKCIQSLAAKIAKATAELKQFVASGNDSSVARLKDQVAKNVIEARAAEARAQRALQSIAVGVDGTIHEKTSRRLQHKKLSDNLSTVSQSITDAEAAFQVVMLSAEKAVPNAIPMQMLDGHGASLPSSLPSSAPSSFVRPACPPSGSVEMFPMAPDGQQTSQGSFVTQAVLEELQLNEELIDERTEGIQNINRDIQGIQQIYQELATQVTMQGEELDNIESSMLSSVERTAEANTQIQRASGHQRKHTKLIAWLCCLSIVGVIIIIVVVVKAQKHTR